MPSFQHLTGGGDELSIAEDTDLVVGVDTHRDTHSAAIYGARGRVLSQLQVSATPAGYADLLAWASSSATASSTGPCTSSPSTGCATTP